MSGDYFESNFADLTAVGQRYLSHQAQLNISSQLSQQYAQSLRHSAELINQQKTQNKSLANIENLEKRRISLMQDEIAERKQKEEITRVLRNELVEGMDCLEELISGS